MTHSPQLCVKTADNCENRYFSERQKSGQSPRAPLRGNFTCSFVSRREVDCEQLLASAKNTKGEEARHVLGPVYFTRAFVSRRDERLLTAFLAE